MDDNSREVRVLVTKDYSIFKPMLGNRPIDDGHVQELQRKIKVEGNLSSEFPIEVNEKMEIVDGQHRIAALAELKYPVYYIVQANQNLKTVRMINKGRRNWTWRDIAVSFAAEGKTQYRGFLGLATKFDEGKRVLLRYVGFPDKHGALNTPYNDGDLVIADLALATKLLTQLKEVEEALPAVHGQMFALSMYDIMTSTAYDHKRMLYKVANYGSSLKFWASKKDYLRNIEDIYNFNQGEANRVRLF